jgi:hypothetical protein
MKTPPFTRRIVITATIARGYLVETEYATTCGDWTTMSRTWTETFPFQLIARVVSRPDYRVHVRAAEGGQ